MARTKKITLYYQLLKDRILPPSPVAVKRKDDMIREQQKAVEAEWKPKLVEVTYRITSPDVLQQRRFFEGAVVDYFVIQSKEILDGRPDPKERRRYRETLLSNVLGYDVELVDRKERRRTSTTDMTDTQEWHDFLETLRETEFEPQGYEFPDSGKFWKVAEEVGYDKAKEVVIAQLQDRLRKKLSTESTAG